MNKVSKKQNLGVIIIQMEKFRKDGTGHSAQRSRGNKTALRWTLSLQLLLGCNTMYSSRNLPTFQCKFIWGCM